MNKILFFSITLFCTHFFASEVEILTYAQENLPQTGILRSSNGFVYLDIDDNYIYELIPFIESAGFETPPYFGKERLVGAHISVIFPNELENGIIEECGKEFSFQLKNCITIKPEQFKGLVEFYFLIVEAPELNRLREKYDLARSEHNFHVTIGIKKKCPLTLDASGHFQTINSLD
jgi:hypothetical protein